jgi:hypothetical protein
MMESVAKERNGPPCRGEPPLEWIAEERRGEKTSEFNRPDKLGDIVGARQIPSRSFSSSALAVLVLCIYFSQDVTGETSYKTDPTIHHHPLRSSSSFSLSIPFGVLYDFRSRFTQHWRPHSPAASTDRLN